MDIVSHIEFVKSYHENGFQVVNLNDGLDEWHNIFPGVILLWKVSILRKFSTPEKIVNFWENSQVFRKFSTLEIRLNSWEKSQLLKKVAALGENSQHFRKFLTLEKILNPGDKSEFMTKVSAPQKSLKSWENSQLLRKF